MIIRVLNYQSKKDFFLLSLFDYTSQYATVVYHTISICNFADSDYLIQRNYMLPP